MSKRLTFVLLMFGFLGGWVVSDLSNNVVTAQEKKDGASRDPKWLHAMELRARKAGEIDWKDAKKHSIEVFRDENNGNRLYVNSAYANLGIIETDGIDLNFTWRSALEDLGLAKIPGALGVNLQFSKLLSYDMQDFPTQDPRSRTVT